MRYVTHSKKVFRSVLPQIRELKCFYYPPTPLKKSTASTHECELNERRGGDVFSPRGSFDYLAAAAAQGWLLDTESHSEYANSDAWVHL